MASTPHPGPISQAVADKREQATGPNLYQEFQALRAAMAAAGIAGQEIARITGFERDKAFSEQAKRARIHELWTEFRGAA